MKARSFTLVITLGVAAFVGAGPGVGATPPATQCGPGANYAAASTPVAFWSTEARCAIVPPTAGPENFGNKFPGEAAVYLGIVHVAIFDAAVAIEGGYQPYTTTPTARVLFRLSSAPVRVPKRRASSSPKRRASSSPGRSLRKSVSSSRRPWGG